MKLGDQTDQWYGSELPGASAALCDFPTTRRRFPYGRSTKHLLQCFPHHKMGAKKSVIMNELTREQVDDLRRTAEYLTLQMRLTPHPTERTRIRVMADTADFVAERIDAFLRAGAQDSTHASHR